MNRTIQLLIKANALVFSFVIPFAVVYVHLDKMYTQPSSPDFVYSADASANIPIIPLASTTLPQKTHVKFSAFKIDRVDESIAEPVLEQVALCESGGDPLAKSKASTAKGLLQIINGTWKAFNCTGSVLDPNDNMQCAIKIVTTSGLHHWDESRKCWAKNVSNLQLSSR